MNVDKLRKNFRTTIKKENFKVTFFKDMVTFYKERDAQFLTVKKLKLDYLIEGARNSEMNTNIIIDGDTMYIEDIGSGGSSGPYAKMFLYSLDYWIHYAELFHINKVVLKQTRTQDEYYSYFNLSQSVGFKLTDDSEYPSLQTNEYTSNLAYITDIESYFLRKKHENKQSDFDCKGIFSAYQVNQYYSVLCYVDSIQVILNFFNDNGQYRFVEAETDTTWHFREDNMEQVLEDYFIDFKNQQKLKTLIDPPYRELEALLKKLPKGVNLQQTKLQTLMLSLIEHGYSYKEIEDDSLKLRETYQKERKNRKVMNNLINTSHIIYHEGEDICLGWFSILQVDLFIKFNHHYVLFTLGFDNEEEVEYEIFTTFEQVKNRIRDAVDHQLSSIPLIL